MPTFLIDSDALVEGAPKPFTIQGREIVVVRHDGAAYGLGNVCTHAYALLTDGWYEDGCIECPLHQAAFDVRTGEPQCGPATQALETYPIVEQDGKIWIHLEPANNLEG